MRLLERRRREAFAGEDGGAVRGIRIQILRDLRLEFPRALSRIPRGIPHMPLVIEMPS
jgi:hypothetical protein